MGFKVPVGAMSRFSLCLDAQRYSCQIGPCSLLKPMPQTVPLIILRLLENSI